MELVWNCSGRIWTGSSPCIPDLHREAPGLSALRQRPLRALVYSPVVRLNTRSPKERFGRRQIGKKGNVYSVGHPHLRETPAPDSSDAGRRIHKVRNSYALQNPIHNSMGNALGAATAILPRVLQVQVSTLVTRKRVT